MADGVPDTIEIDDEDEEVLLRTTRPAPTLVRGVGNLTLYVRLCLSSCKENNGGLFCRPLDISVPGLVSAIDLMPSFPRVWLGRYEHFMAKVNTAALHQ